MFEVEKRKRFDRIFPIVWSIFIFLGIAGVSFYYYLAKNRPTAEIPKSIIEEAVETEVAETSQPSKEVKEEIIQAPPKRPTSSKIQGKKISTSAGQAVAVSTGGDLTSEEVAQLSTYSTLGGTTSISYNDTTGRYPDLGDTLRSFVNNNLLHTTELSYMYEIKIVDCAACNYSGLYTGSYMQSGSDITKAYGYITLNALPYKDSTRFVDYMKLILSHEYGHHYSLYHRWVDLDIPSGVRFPDAYYTVRPLPKATTTYDYSLGWENCDAEILAEDYSYIYSGYGYHGMSDVYGYPSNPGTKNWLISLGQTVSSAPATSSTPTAPATTPTAEPVAPTTPTADTILPTVAFLKPQNGSTVSGDFEIQVSASDDVKLQKIELYFDGQLILSIEKSFIGMMDSTKVANGSHTLKAKAFDSSGNVKEVTISVIVDNQTAPENAGKKK